MTEQEAENQDTDEQETQERDTERSSGRSRRPSSERSQTTRKQGTTRKRSTSSSSESSSRTKRRNQESHSQESSQRSSKPKIAAGKAIVAAIEQLRYLTTREPESVVGAVPHDDGWRVTVEVLESQRIPDTADIMAEYDVDIDGDGELVGYQRRGRYFRGQTQRTDDGR